MASSSRTPGTGRATRAGGNRYGRGPPAAHMTLPLRRRPLGGIHIHCGVEQHSSRSAIERIIGVGEPLVLAPQLADVLTHVALYVQWPEDFLRTSHFHHGSTGASDRDHGSSKQPA